LRAVGFLPKHLSGFIIGEATLLGLLGGALGVALGIPLINQGVGRFMEEKMTGFFPYFRVMPRDVVLALTLSVVLAVVAAIIPAYNAGKLP
jgi:putative ABC transport system permease protein